MRNPSRQIRAHQRRTAPGKSARAPTAIRARRRWYQKARDSREQKAANDQHLILEEERFSNSTSPQATASRRFCGVIPSPDVIRGLWRPPLFSRRRPISKNPASAAKLANRRKKLVALDNKAVPWASPTRGSRRSRRLSISPMRMPASSTAPGRLYASSRPISAASSVASQIAGDDLRAARPEGLQRAPDFECIGRGWLGPAPATAPAGMLHANAKCAGLWRFASLRRSGSTSPHRFDFDDGATLRSRR